MANRNPTITRALLARLNAEMENLLATETIVDETTKQSLEEIEARLAAAGIDVDSGFQRLKDRVYTKEYLADGGMSAIRPRMDPVEMTDAAKRASTVHHSSVRRSRPGRSSCRQPIAARVVRPRESVPFLHIRREQRAVLSDHPLAFAEYLDSWKFPPAQAEKVLWSDGSIEFRAQSISNREDSPTVRVSVTLNASPRWERKDFPAIEAGGR